TGGLGTSAVGHLPRKDLAAGGSAIAFGLALCGIVLVHTMPATALLLFVMGVLQTVCVASVNTTIQTVVHDGMRGRVMSMMTVILFGFATAGALMIGFLGDRIGVPQALAGGGLVIAVVATAVLAWAPAPPGGLAVAAQASDDRRAGWGCSGRGGAPQRRSSYPTAPPATATTSSSATTRTASSCATC